MIRRIKGKTIPVLLFGAVLIMGLFSAGCDEGPLEDVFEPVEPEEVEENAE